MTRRNASRCTRKRRAFSRTRIPDRVGILRFAVSDLFSWGRNSPHYGRTGEPLAVPTSRYPYRRHPWRDSGVPFVEYSPRRSHPRLQPYRTHRTRIVRVQGADCHPCDHTPNTISTYFVPKPTPRRYPRLGFSLVVEKRCEAVERPPVQVEIAVVAPPRFAVLVVLPEYHRGRPRQVYRHFVRHTPPRLLFRVRARSASDDPFASDQDEWPLGTKSRRLAFFLREVVFVLFECATRIQQGFPTERDGGEVANPRSTPATSSPGGSGSMVVRQTNCSRHSSRL